MSNKTLMQPISSAFQSLQRKLVFSEIKADVGECKTFELYNEKKKEWKHFSHSLQINNAWSSQVCFDVNLAQINSPRGNWSIIRSHGCLC